MPGTTLLHLPFDVLVKIFALLPARTHLDYATVCSTICDVVTHIGLADMLMLPLSRLAELAQMQDMTPRLRSLLSRLSGLCMTYTTPYTGNADEISISLHPLKLKPRTLILNLSQDVMSLPDLLYGMVECYQVLELRILQTGFRLQPTESNIMPLLRACAATVQRVDLCKIWQKSPPSPSTVALRYPCLQHVTVDKCYPSPDGLLDAILACAPRLISLELWNMVQPDSLDYSATLEIWTLLRLCGSNLTYLCLGFNIPALYADKKISQVLERVPNVIEARFCNIRFRVSLLQQLRSLTELHLQWCCEPADTISSLEDASWLPTLRILSAQYHSEVAMEREKLVGSCGKRNVQLVDYYAYAKPPWNRKQ